MSSNAAVNKASDVKGACGLAPETKELEQSAAQAEDMLAPKTAFHAVVTKLTSLWENEMTITYSFFGGTYYQKKAVDDTVPEWTRYANLKLHRLNDNDSSAMVRIGFLRNSGSWSSVGKGALQVEKDKITMNLGWLEDSPTVSANDRGTILHEWGHALGLMHEHQSPARGGTITLKESEVIRYYHATQGWSEALIRSQILQKYQLDNVSNFSALDTISVMMYFMPGYLNEQGITVHVNNELSEMDKAYMLINYPRRVADPQTPTYTMKWALDKAGVPPREQKEILSMKDANEIRLYFATWCKEARAAELEKTTSAPGGNDEISQLISSLYGGGSSSNVSYGLNASAPKSADPAASNLPGGVEHGLLSGIVGVLKHPAFHKVVSNVVDAALTQRGLSPSGYTATYNAQQGLFNTTSPGIWTPHSKLSPGIWQQHGLNAPADAQQGLFSIAASILKHPVFHKAVSTVVDAALTQRGIQPGPAAPDGVQQGLLSDVGSLFGFGLDPQQATAAHNLDVQQGLFSGIVNIIKHPAFQKVVHTAVNSALTQRGINPATSTAVPSVDAQQGLLSDIGSLFGLGLNPQQAAAVASQNANVQQGLLSDIGSLFGLGLNPQQAAAMAAQNANVQQGLLGDIGSLFGLGLNPQQAALAAQNLDVQQGLFSGIASVLKHPVFQKVVHTAVNSALAQHGIKPTVPAGMPSADVQQGLLSDIGSLFGLGLNPQQAAAVAAASQYTSSNVQQGLYSNTQQATTAAQNLDFQQGLFTNVLRHPVFQKVVHTAVNSALSQHGIKPIVPTGMPSADVQQGLLSDIGSLFGLGLNPQQAAAVAAAASQYSSSDVQQGLFSDTGHLLGPGHNPHQAGAAAQHSQANIQQGLFSNILKHPVFQKVVHTAVNSALAQHGVKPSGPTGVPSADAQQGLLSDIGSLFGLGLNPQQVAAASGNANVQQGLLSDIGSLFGLGLNPQQAAAVAQNPDIQQGLFTNILKHPVFQKVVHTAINSALSQHGINPSTSAGMPSADAQQGLLSDIGSLFGLGLNPETGLGTSHAAHQHSHHTQHAHHSHHHQQTHSQYGNTVATYGDTVPNASAPGTDNFQRTVYSKSVVTQRGLQTPAVSVDGSHLKISDGNPTSITPPGSDKAPLSVED